MNKKQLESHLLELGFKKEQYNTNNDWGFGGSSGFTYTKNEDWIDFGKHSYRHAPSTKFIRGGGIFTEVDSVKDIAEILKTHLPKI